jgi:chromosome segregation ATPase
MSIPINKALRSFVSDLSDLVDQVDRCNGLENRERELSASVEALAQERDRIRASNAQAAADAQAAAEQVRQSLDAELSKRRNEALAQIDADLAALQVAYETTKAANDAARESLAGWQAQCDQAQAKMAEMEARCASMAKQAEAAQAVIARAEAIKVAMGT